MRLIPVLPSLLSHVFRCIQTWKRCFNHGVYLSIIDKQSSYMDVKYVADLLPDGRIMDPATNEVYTSPSIYSCTIKVCAN